MTRRKCLRFGDGLCGSMGPRYEYRSMEEIQRLSWDTVLLSRAGYAPRAKKTGVRWEVDGDMRRLEALRGAWRTGTRRIGGFEESRRHRNLKRWSHTCQVSKKWMQQGEWIKRF